jgi:hypothetical protein
MHASHQRDLRMIQSLIKSTFLPSTSTSNSFTGALE